MQKHLPSTQLSYHVVVFVVGADQNGSIPTIQVKWVFIFLSCHLLSLLRKGTLLKGVLKVFSEYH